jgi:hypothetical protein
MKIMRGDRRQERSPLPRVQIRGSTVQHDLSVEREAAPFQDPPRGRICWSYQPYDAASDYIFESKSNGFRHQFRGKSLAPIIRMKMVRKVEAFKFL